MDLEFQMRYSVTSEPSWLTDNGTATAMINNASIKMSLLPLASPDGVLQIDFKRMEISMTDYKVKADGSSDLSKAVEIVFNSFKSFFKNELANMLAWRMAKSVEESMNTLMMTRAGIVPMPELDNVFFNATMLSDPIFEKDYITIPIDGTISMRNSNDQHKAGSMPSA